jgi:Outer membrane protein beta-barrel domain
MIFKKGLLILMFFLNFVLFAQNEPDLSDPSKIKHQIGIGISNFINSAFSSDKGAFEVEYRYKFNTKISFRTGGIYQKDDSEDGFVETGLKLGVDRNLKKYKKWNFFYGLDLTGTYSKFKNINKDNYSYGIAPFIGIQYKISDNFSLSIEPNLYIKQNIIVDNSTFSIDNKTKWTESGLGKLGYIQLNFHF